MLRITDETSMPLKQQTVRHGRYIMSADLFIEMRHSRYMSAGLYPEMHQDRHMSATLNLEMRRTR